MGLETVDNRLFVLEQAVASDRKIDSRLTLIEEHMAFDRRVDKYMLRFIALLATMKFLGLEHVQDVLNIFHPAVNVQQLGMMATFGVSAVWITNRILSRTTPPHRLS